MIIRDARFLTSNSRADLCPAPTLPEYAFIGRSNGAVQYLPEPNGNLLFPLTSPERTYA